MAAFSSTIRASLEMDTTPFQKGMTSADRRLVDFANNTRKSARDSANVFTEVAAAEERLNAARVAQAEATNRSITASQGAITKSARESASVFEDLFAKEKQAAEAAKEAAAAMSSADQAEAGRGGFGATGVSDAARRMAGDLQRSDGLLAKIRGKFTAGNILTSVLGGVGLGSGFAIAEKAADAISSYWRSAAESAERIAAFSDRSLAATLKLISFRETDEQRLDKAQRREKSLSDQLYVASRATIGRDPERIARLTAELQEASVERVEAEKKVQEKLAEVRKKAEEQERESRDREVQWQIESGEREREMFDEEARRQKEISEADREANRLEQQAHEKEADTLDLLNAAEAKRVIIEDHLLSLQEGTLAFHEARQDLAENDIEISRLKAKFLEEERRREEAINKVVAARATIGAARRDQVAFSVEEAASGRRGNLADRQRARQIARLEREAQRAYDRGGEVTETRDQRGNVVRETGEQRSARLQREAEELRNGFGRAKSSERDPLKAYKDALKQAEESLKSIDEKLTAEEV